MRRKAGIMKLTKPLALSVALVAALAITVYADESDPLLVEANSNVAVKYDVNDTYRWHYDAELSKEHASVVYVAGNSGADKREASVSNIALTVTGKGTLTFDYKVDTPEDGNATYSGDGEYYGLFYSVGTEITADNYSSAGNAGKGWLSNYAVKADWGTVTVPINSVGTDGTATVYVAYYRYGNASNNDQNYVAISNVSFSSNQKTLTVVGSDNTNGSVAVTVDSETQTATSGDGAANRYEVSPGATAKLTATVKDDIIFYGWTDGSTLLSTDLSYTATVTDNTTIYAVYGPKGTYTARKNGVFYTAEQGGLAAALAEAKSGDTVVMLASQTLEKNATVPEGVFLLLPYQDNDTGYDPKKDEYPTDGVDKTLNSNYVVCYGKLTIDSGAKLTVEGTVLVNAMIGTNGQTNGVDQGQISRGYAAIDLAGNIVIESGGYMENVGEVNGTGRITVNSGGTLTDRYVIVNWRGGSQASHIVSAGVYPMNETDCHSITSEILIHSGGTFSGVVKVRADEKFTNTRFPLVDNKNGMIRLGAGATLLKTYNSDTKRSTLTINGGATFGESSLTIVGISLTTAKYLFPVDGDTGFVLQNGTYTVADDFKLMPGCTVDVENGATLHVNSGVTLVAYDGFEDAKYNDDTEYPSGRDPATLTLHGGAAMTVNGSFAGRLVLDSGATTDSYATAKFSKSAATSVTSYETNGWCNGVKPLDFKAELWNSSTAKSTITPQTARTYYGANSGWTLVEPGQSAITGDLNQDGVVDILDLNKALADGNSDAYNTVLNGYQTTNSSD